MGTAIVSFPNHPVASNQEAMVGIGERHIKGIRLGFQIDCLPRASAGCWNASGYASTQANAEHKDKDKIDGG
jgi:hypothetical protein